MQSYQEVLYYTSGVTAVTTTGSNCRKHCVSEKMPVPLRRSKLRVARRRHRFDIEFGLQNGTTYNRHLQKLNMRYPEPL
ncbi:hypothetical protein [Nostoc sp.]|uniref:hypothetical protein n=1 Tax=Nostoc sp. TaxID=1180 RepID=UPI002FFAD75A